MNFSSNFLLAMPGGGEWILIIVAILLLFGARKVPEFMKGLGKGIREFNEAKENTRPGSGDSIGEKP